MPIPHYQYTQHELEAPFLTTLSSTPHGDLTSNLIMPADSLDHTILKTDTT